VSYGKYIYFPNACQQKNDTIAKKYFEVWSVKQKKGRTGADQKREKYSLFIADKEERL
jgi:hypothetical protein